MNTSEPSAPNTNTNKKNNANTVNTSTDETVESLQDKLDEGITRLQEKIQSGDCDAMNKEVKNIVNTGNSIVALINAGRSKESNFGDAKGKLQVATENIKVKCPPKQNQTGGKRKTRKTRKQKRKSRRV